MTRSPRVVVMHLGGNVDRVQTTAAVAREFPDATVVISGELAPALVLERLRHEFIWRSRVEFDFRPWDTVTHFTFIADELRAADVTELHVVTDRFHLRRACWIARLVLFGSGIRVVGHAHHDPLMWDRRDPRLRLVKDLWRSVVWNATGLLIYDAGIRERRLPAIRASRVELHAIDRAAAGTHA